MRVVVLGVLDVCVCVCVCCYALTPSEPSPAQPQPQLRWERMVVTAGSKGTANFILKWWVRAPLVRDISCCIVSG